MKSNHARKVSEQAFNELVEAVEAGKSQKLVEYLKAMGRFHKYSLGNAILIGFQKPNATHVAGFRTWQKLGRYVKKGEHGIAIMAPIVWRRKVTPADDQDDKEDREEDTSLTFKTVYVFDVSQTEGKPLPELTRAEGNPGSYTERLERFISGRGIKLERSNLSLVHETAHEMLHVDPTNRPKDKTVREAEAEAVAFVVCHGIGLDTNTTSSDYIQLYNGDKGTLVKSLERIQRTASEILGAVMDREPEGVATDEEPCAAVAA
ncbi:MAG: ArdC family protein [Planctomycetota bacterium]|jgi:antirestriction protein ArdC